MSKISDKKEIIKLAKQLATPIDFERLDNEGVIEKKGAWYKIKKPLPEHVSRQVKAIKTDSKGNCYVQLPKSWRSAQQLYRCMNRNQNDRQRGVTFRIVWHFQHYLACSVISHSGYARNFWWAVSSFRLYPAPFCVIWYIPMTRGTLISASELKIVLETKKSSE